MPCLDASLAVSLWQAASLCRRDTRPLAEWERHAPCNSSLQRGATVKRILVATDFSEHAERARAWGAALARRFGAELELFTSVYVPPVAPGPHGILPGFDLRPIRAAADERLERMSRDAVSAGLRVSREIGCEDPSTAICARARETHADLIVQGTRGRSGLAHVLLGSVAERVARLAPCTVLTAHAGSPEPRPLRKLLVASDFSDESRAAVALARELVEPGGELVIAHAIPVVLGPGDPPEPLPDPTSESWARLQFAKLGAALEGVRARLELCHGVPDVTVLAAAERLGADAIAIGTRGRSALAHVLLGSVAERVLRRAALPVFTAKAAYK
jgi:nucleotide-binding universal stress UspA family protein